MYERNVQWVEDMVREQNAWRISTLNLVASENVMSNRARWVMGSDFTHRYAEGHPGERYYQGTDKIDEIESRVKQHLKALLHCRHLEVRPISGTVANDVVFSRYIRPGDIVMVNSTPGGGHISHHRSGSVGKFTQNIIEFPLMKDGYHIDIDKTFSLVKILKPKLIVVGRSLILVKEPVASLAEMVKNIDCAIIYDAAHVLGLIAGRQFQDPLSEGATLVSASTHKTFFGPQRGIIYSNMGNNEWRRIDKGAFPGSSSNHHLDTLVPLAITAYEFLEFGVEYAKQVIQNAKALAHGLVREGFEVEGESFDYTETHQVAVNVKNLGGGDEVARILKDNSIILNMNLLPHESLENVENPSGIRLGVQEMTRFGMKEQEMECIAMIIRRCLKEGQFMGDEVKEFRMNFRRIHYSFDEGEAAFHTPYSFCAGEISPNEVLS